MVATLPPLVHYSYASDLHCLVAANGPCQDVDSQANYSVDFDLNSSVLDAAVDESVGE